MENGIFKNLLKKQNAMSVSSMGVTAIQVMF